MSNAVYPAYREAVIQGASNSSLTGTVKAALIDTGAYTYSAAHQFWSSASSAVVGTPQTLASKTYVGGLFDAADVVYSALGGVTVEAIILYIDTGVAGTSRLVAYIDTGVGGLPLTPDGTDTTITWSASGIVQF